MHDPLVGTGWLADRLATGAVQVVDATMPRVGQTGRGRDDYLEQHIPGAVFFDIDALSDPMSELPHMLPASRDLATAIGALGLHCGEPIVVYDGIGIYSAPRTWWTLRVMGFSEVFVLDGGLPKWRAEGRPTEAGEHAMQAVALDAQLDARLIADLEQVRSALAGTGSQLVDARPAARFRGDVGEPRTGLRRGHMPGALNVPFDSVVAADGTMRSLPELRELFSALDLRRPIIASCGSGVTACVLALALARLGRDDVAVYDGSWAEWGGRGDTPVEWSGGDVR